MSENLRMDSHKLIFHPRRLSDWLNGIDIYPLTVEISLSGACNHRCIFCGLDYLGYRPRFLDKDTILVNLQLMHEKGVRAIVLAGEGEPLLNRDTPEIVTCSRRIGLDVGMSTNGVLFSRSAAQECLPSLTWIRFSVNAAGEEQYQAVHRGRRGDFDRVLQNIADAVRVKDDLHLGVTIGVQMVLIPEIAAPSLTLPKGCGRSVSTTFPSNLFLSIPRASAPWTKPSTTPPFSISETRLQEFATDQFQVMFRSRSMKKLKDCRRYDRCLGLPFFAFIDAAANVFPCVAYLGQDEFSFGNLEEQDFQAIWSGARRQEIMSLFSRMDVSGCRELCRLDEINGYLHDLVNPGAHVNFI